MKKILLILPLTTALFFSTTCFADKDIAALIVRAALNGNHEAADSLTEILVQNDGPERHKTILALNDFIDVLYDEAALATKGQQGRVINIALTIESIVESALRSENRDLSVTNDGTFAETELSAFYKARIKRLYKKLDALITAVRAMMGDGSAMEKLNQNRVDWVYFANAAEFLFKKYSSDENQPMLRKLWDLLARLYDERFKGKAENFLKSTTPPFDPKDVETRYLHLYPIPIPRGAKGEPLSFFPPLPINITIPNPDQSSRVLSTLLNIAIVLDNNDIWIELIQLLRKRRYVKFYSSGLANELTQAEIEKIKSRIFAPHTLFWKKRISPNSVKTLTADKTLIFFDGELLSKEEVAVRIEIIKKLLEIDRPIIISFLKKSIREKTIHSSTYEILEQLALDPDTPEKIRTTAANIIEEIMGKDYLTHIRHRELAQTLEAIDSYKWSPTIRAMLARRAAVLLESDPNTADLLSEDKGITSSDLTKAARAIEKYENIEQAERRYLRNILENTAKRMREERGPLKDLRIKAERMIRRTFMP